MKRFLLITLLLTALFGWAPVVSSAQDLAQRGAKQIEGVVTKQSRGSFILKDAAGEEKTFRIGKRTQYLPADYRSLDGDTVRVGYVESFGNTGKLKRSVLQIAPIAIADKNQPLPNPIRGEIVRYGKASSHYWDSLLVQIPGQEDAIIIYLPNDTIPIEINGKPGTLPGKVAGKRAEIVARRIPIKRGNAYLYEAEKVAITDQAVAETASAAAPQTSTPGSTDDKQ